MNETLWWTEIEIYTSLKLLVCWSKADDHKIIVSYWLQIQGPTDFALDG
jgi:hypothetical protein